MEQESQFLLCSDDPQQLQQWRDALSADPRFAIWGDVSDGGGSFPDLIVTDRLPVDELIPGMAAEIAAGGIGIVAMGVGGPADASLPIDHSQRELQLASRLLAELVRLRRANIELQRSQQSLRRMVYRDSLTGLANRRRWDQELVDRIDKMQAGQGAGVLGVVMFDLDLFKQLNDQHGHVAGDTALRHAAQKLAANLAEQHIAARIGGDEFGVLLSGVLASDVMGVAESLRVAMGQEIETGDGQTAAVSASAGVVVVAASSRKRPTDVLRAADDALRRAKKQGRDQAVLGGLESEA